MNRVEAPPRPGHEASERRVFWYLVAAAAFGAVTSALVIGTRIDDEKRSRAVSPPEPTTSAEIPSATTPSAPKSNATPTPSETPAPTPSPEALTPAEPAPAARSEVAPAEAPPSPPAEQPGPIAETAPVSAAPPSTAPPEDMFAVTRPLPVTVGAGPFLTTPPPWAASAMTPNPSAGAGPFLTDSPFYTSSAMTPNPNAGAGPFLTETSSAGAMTSPGEVRATPASAAPVAAPSTAEATARAGEITFVPTPMPVFVPMGDIRATGTPGLSSVTAVGPSSAPVGPTFGATFGPSAAPSGWTQALTPSDPFRGSSFGTPAPSTFGLSPAAITPMFGTTPPPASGWPTRSW